MNTREPLRTASSLRRANRADLLRTLHRNGGGASRTELAELSGMSPATVSVLVGDLLARGVLVPDGHTASGGGRPRERLRFDPGFGHVLGIDVAETYVHAQAFDLALAAGTHWSVDRGPAEVSDLLELCERAVRELAVPRLIGVGVSVPGLVDARDGRVVRSPDGRQRDVPIGAPLAGRLGLPVVHLDNPLRASVLAELWAGAGRDQPDLAVLTLGTGIGAGFAVDGRLRRGATDLAGEWGHVPIAGGERRTCRCGQTDCLEAYLGAPGIIASLRAAGPVPPGDEQDQIARFAGRIDAADLMALEVRDQLAAQLADGLVVLRHLLDPGVVVASGWVADALGDRLLAPAAAAAERRMLRPAPDRWLRRSTLGAAQVTLGAAALALDDAFDRVAATAGT